MSSIISFEKRLDKLYEAHVVSVIMYNSLCWAALAAALENLKKFPSKTSVKFYEHSVAPQYI